MVDRTVKAIGVLHDVLVNMESFIFPVDFVILNCEVHFEVHIILRRPFLDTGCTLVNMDKGKINFHIIQEEVTFNIYISMKLSSELNSVSTANNIEESRSNVPIKERLGSDTLARIMINFNSNGIEDYNELVAALDKF